MAGKLTYMPASGGRSVEHLVSQRLTYVGRDKDCAIRLEDKMVDGKQFVISFNDHETKIQNLSRKLPTLVNQQAIGLREDWELKDQDTISLGNKKFLWTMSSSSGRRNTPRHDCLKRTRVSEPVRKVAVVTPNRRETPLVEDWVALPPEKRRRTMYDPAAVTPEVSAYTRRVKYDKQLKQRMTPNRRKQSMGKRTPAPSSSKKSMSFTQSLESPQLTYSHETAFNKSITPRRFYRRNDAHFTFRGFNPVPEEPMSPGLLSGSDSFLSMDDTQMSRRSSGRVSTPHPNKSLRGSTQLNKTSQSGRPSGLCFQSIQEEVTQPNQHDATPPSYFSSTSGSPRIMRAESPTILPGGSGSPFQGRRSLVHSSRSSSYGPPQEQSLHSHNNSLYVNASNSSQMRLQDFEGSSMNQSRYSWTNEGIPSPRGGSFSKTPLHMHTPRRSRGPIESPGSAVFSPNPSEANTSGYVLLSPQGRSIINRAFNRNDMSLRLSPKHSPSRRLFNFSARTPHNRRGVEPAQPLSVQVLTKSLKKKLDRSALSLNSTQNLVGTPCSSGRGRTSKNPDASVKTPTTTEPVQNTTPKSTRSTSSKRATPRQSSVPNVFAVSRKSLEGSQSILSPVVACTRRSSGKMEDKGMPQAKFSKRSLGATPRQSSEPDVSRLSRKSSDRSQNIPSSPVEVPYSEPRRGKKYSEKSSPSTSPASDCADLAPDELTPPNTSVEVNMRSSRSISTKRITPSSSRRGRASMNSDAFDRNPTTAEHNGTPKSIRATGSKRASVRQSSEPDLSRLSRKSSDRSQNIPSSPVEVPYSEPRRGKKYSEKSSPSTSPASDCANLAPDELTPPNTSVEVNMRSSRSISTKRITPSSSRRGRASMNSDAFDRTPATAEHNGTPKSIRASGSKRASVRQSSEPDLSRLSRKSSDRSQSILSSPVEVPYSEPRRGKKYSEKSSSASASPACDWVDISPHKLTPPNTSVEVNMRSSRRISIKRTTPASSGRGRTSMNTVAFDRTPTTAEHNGTPKRASVRQSSEPDLAMMSRKSEVVSSTSTPVFASARISMKVDEKSTPRLSKRSLAATPRESSEPELSTLSRKSGQIISSPPVEVHYNEPKRSKRNTEKSSSPSKSPASVSMDLSLSNTSVEVNLRSSRKMFSEEKDSPTPSTAGPKSSARNSIPVSLNKSDRKSLKEIAPAKGSGSPISSRRSRASLVGVAAQLLHLSASPDSSKKTPDQTKRVIPEINVILSTPTPSRSSRATPASGRPVLGHRSSRRSGTPGVVPLHQSTHKTAIEKGSSLKSETPEASVQEVAQASGSSSRSASVSPIKSVVRTSVPIRRSRASLVGDSAQLLHLSASPDIAERTPSPTKMLASATPASGKHITGRRSSRKSGTPCVVSLHRSIRKTSIGKKSSLKSETPEASIREVALAKGSESQSEPASPVIMNIRTSVSSRRSRASLVGDAAHLLHLSESPDSSKKTQIQTKRIFPEFNVIPTTPPKSSGVTPASGEPVSGRRSSRQSGTPRTVSVHQGIRKTSVGKKASVNSEIPGTSGSAQPKSPGKLSSSMRSTQRGSAGDLATADRESPSTSQSPPPRTSRSSKESSQVTPPRSVEPEIVMRSSRKTPRPQSSGNIPSTPTSAFRRNQRRGVKRSPIPSIHKKLGVSPRKDSVAKKLSLDPEKPDKNKMAALIACHKKKSPAKENYPSTSSLDKKTSSGRSTPENPPLNDGQPEERSPEDGFLDALDLSRKSAIVSVPKRPSRRLRSSTNQLSAKASSSSESSPVSLPKSVKKLLFKTPLVEYEESHTRLEKSPSRGLKGILMPSPTTPSEEPMSRVFTTSPVVDFTDANGRKKTFRTSPNTKSKAGGIRELVPADESDLNIRTLFEDSSSGSGSTGRKRKGSEHTDTSPPKKSRTPLNVDSASPLQSKRRMCAPEGNAMSSKPSRKATKESVEDASPKSARKSTTLKAATSKSTRRNLQEQFVHSPESPKPSTSRESPNPSTSKVASPKVSPKQLRKVGAKGKAASKAQMTKKAPIQSKVGSTKAHEPATPEKSPAKTRSKSATKPSRKSPPKPILRAGKTATTKPKTSASKAKPKKVTQPAKAPSKASGAKLRKLPSPGKSPLKPRRGAVSKSPKKAVLASKTQSKASGGKASKSSTPATSPAKSRRGALAKSPKKGVQKIAPKAGKTGKSAKSPPKASNSKLKSPPKAAVSKAKPAKAKSSPKATASKVKSSPKATASKAKPTKASSKAKSSPKATPSKAKPKKANNKAKSPAKGTTSKAKPTKATTSKAKSTKAPAQKVSPKKTRGKLANVKAASKPALLAKPKATGAKRKSGQSTKPRLSVALKPLRGRAVGGKLPIKSPTPKKSPVKTRSRKPAAASTASSSRGKR